MSWASAPSAGPGDSDWGRSCALRPEHPGGNSSAKSLKLAHIAYPTERIVSSVPGLYFALTLASILGGKTFWNASWKQNDCEISLILNASFMHERNEVPRVTQLLQVIQTVVQPGHLTPLEKNE